jgi:hypothetical protein
MSDDINVFLSDDPDTPHPFNTAVEQRDVKARLVKDKPAVIDLATTVPAVFEPGKMGDCPRFVDDVWNDLRVYEIGIRLSLDQMQKQGAAITRGLSWEQTVEDFAAELYLFPPLMALSEFRHLFLCCGSGLVHIENVKAVCGASARLKGRLYFSPEQKEIDTPPKSIFKLLKRLRRYPDRVPPLNGRVSVEIPDFVLARPMPNQPRSPRRWHILNQTLEDAPVHRINVAVAIVRADLEKVLNRKWKKPQVNDPDYDLWQTLTRVEFWNPHDRAPDFVTLPARSRPAMPAQSRRDLPVIKGTHDHQEFRLAVPIENFKALYVAEREQIENLRDIKRLFNAYISEKRDDDNDKFRHPKPLSIAVFGPPGAGKSFTVTEIAKSINAYYNKAGISEFNVAQFRKPEDLTSVFRELSKSSTSSPPPIIFFDEFDSALGAEKLGWLKYFLAPMQDGKYYDEEQNKLKDLPRSIFVFAGGVHTSFENFDPRSELPSPDLAHAVSEEYRKQIARFELRKGPDFISRLRGYINIPDANAGPGRSKHFLRRAIQLRGLLKGKLGIDDDKGRVKVAEEIIYALLTVDRYRHGVRSMEAILRMCPVNAGWITVPSLPSRAQLNMHVDAEEFFIRLYRGRARMEVRSDAQLECKLADLVKRAKDGGNPIAKNIVDLAEGWKEQIRSGDHYRINELLRELDKILPKILPASPA